MPRIDDTLIVRAILSAPGWARVGISDPTPWMREDAAAELARAIRMQAETPEPVEASQRQLTL